MVSPNMNAAEREALLASATAALRQVVDPELGINVVDLGLVASLELHGDIVSVNYRLTSHTCPVGGMITSAMHDALEAVPGIFGAELHLSEDPPWGPELMTPEGRAALGL